MASRFLTWEGRTQYPLDEYTCQSCNAWLSPTSTVYGYVHNTPEAIHDCKRLGVLIGFFCSNRCLKEGASSGWGKRQYGKGGGACSQKSMCFITTAVCEAESLADDCRELVTLRQFRDSHMMADSTRRLLVERYYEIAPELVRRIEARVDRNEIYQELRRNYILPAVEAVEAQHPVAAEEIYTAMISWLSARVG